MGSIELELYPNRAPITVANFLSHVAIDFYDGLIFHRVIPDFMVQGGGFAPGLEYRETPYYPIPLESNNGLSNLRGTIAMARTSELNSATSQFFINHIDNTFLDYSAFSAGYAVFGEVTSGLEVVDQIAAVETGTVSLYSDVPVTDISIISIDQAGLGLAYSNSGIISIGGLEAGATWEYSLDGGINWTEGIVDENNNSLFLLPEGSYLAADIQIRQQDLDGNISSPMLSAADIVVDMTPPVVAITSDVDQLSTGQTAIITFEFSEDPGSSFQWDGETGDLTVTGGTLSVLTGTGLTRTALFTPDTDSLTEGGIAIASGAFTDLALNPNEDGEDADNTVTISVDTTQLVEEVLSVSVKYWSNETPISGVQMDAVTVTDEAGRASIAPNTSLLTPQLAVSEAAAKAVDLQDAILILKQIVGLESFNEYQSIATDFDQNGSTGLNDAIGILKHVVGLPAPQLQWGFVESSNIVDISTPIALNSESSTVDLVGILTGDVDGSFEVLDG